MNADTGIAYELGADLIGEKEIGDKLDAAFFHSRLEEINRPLSRLMRWRQRLMPRRAMPSSG